MIRPLSVVLAALQSVAPHFPQSLAAAEHVRALAIEFRFDPLTMVEYVRGESGWDPSATHAAGDEEYVGLGQVRLNNFYACAEGNAELCAVVRGRMLDWRMNLDKTAEIFANARHFCAVTVGKSDAQYWMQLVKGWDKKRHTVCGHQLGKALPIPAPVRDLLRRRAALAARF